MHELARQFLRFINDVGQEQSVNHIFTFSVFLVTQLHTHLSVIGVKSGCQLSYATATRYIDFMSLQYYAYDIDRQPARQRCLIEGVSPPSHAAVPPILNTNDLCQH